MKRLSPSLLVLAAACGSSQKPAISVFTAAPASVALGESTQLIFSAAGATALKIDPGAIDVTGSTSLKVTPSADTTYTLTATGAGGTDSKQVAVTVKAASPAAFRITHSGEVTAGDETTFTVAALGDSAAVNAFYRGTVQFTIDDAQGTAPAEVTFTAADAGQISVKATFRTAGTRTLVVADKAIASAQGIARVDVAAAAATRLALFGVPDTAVAGDRLAITVSAFDAFGNVATGFTGAVTFASSNPGALLPAGFTFSAADKGSRTVAAVLTRAAVASSITASTPGIPSTTGNVTIKHGSAGQITMEGLAALVPVDLTQTVTVTVRDAFGNPVTDYAGTLHFTNTDTNATAIPDVAFTPTMQGTTDITVQFATDGDQSILVSDTANAALAASTATTVKHGGALQYALSPLPRLAIAGEPLSLGVTALDKHGNVVTDYVGHAVATSTDPRDLLPAPCDFVQGTCSLSLAFVTVGSHFVTVSELGGTINTQSSTTTVVSDSAVSLTVTGGSVTAGAATTMNVTAKDQFDNTVDSYAGTVALSSGDPQASLPAPFTYTAGTPDHGQHVFAGVTLKSAGAQTVTATDAAHALSAIATFTVAPANARTCDMAVIGKAGTDVGLRVVVRDAFQNLATGYAGTMTLSSSDAAAALPGPTAYTSADAGSRDFSATLPTPGDQTISATDAANALSCNARVTIVGGQFFSVTFTGSESWAGAARTATIQAQDTAYAGTIVFTSSDAAATLPASVTLNGTEGGTATVNVTFNTIGLQTFTATDSVDAAKTGTAFQVVHGLIYTNPATGGKVRLVANPASTPGLVQLDLVSNTSLFPLSAGTADTVRNGAFAAGMNLPLDTTKVGPDATFLVTTAPTTVPASTAVLNLGTGTQAKGAVLNNGVLYSGVSQKRTEAGSAVVRGDVAVRPFPGAASFYYSLRLKLTPGAAPGTVFDGQALASNLKFRAAVRDRSGSDVFSGTTDFAIGKLEVK
jgi:hypothetical protein